MSVDSTGNLFDTRQSLAFVWRRLPLLVVFVLVVFAAVFLMSSMRPDIYSAQAKIRVVDPNSETVFGGNQVRIDPKREVDTQLALIRSDDTRRLLNERLGSATSEVASVSAKSVPGTDLISLTVTSELPEVAQQAVNTYAETYVEQRKRQVTEGFTARADDLRNKAAEIDSQIAEIDVKLASEAPETDKAMLMAQRSTLVTQQADLRTRAMQFEVEATTRSGNVTVAETADVPKTPISPLPRRDASVAALLAALLGVAALVVWGRLDDRMRSSEDVESTIDPLPVLGSIPIHIEGKKGARRLPRKHEREIVERHSQAAEAFRSFRVALQFSSLSKQLKTIALTSATQGEGKSTVTANLAVALAESGLRVVVISADLRRPTISTIFGVDESGKGLTTALREQAPLTECLVRVDLDSDHSLYLLPAGELPPNPAEVLGSPNMKKLIDALVDAGTDYVLIDTPPILPVVDALALSQFIDGVVMIAVANQTKRRHLTSAIGRLEKVDADIAGVVVNGIPTRGRLGNLYGYGGYGYGTDRYVSTGS